MRIYGLGLAAVLFAVAPASADVYRQHVTGFGVTTTFATTSDDGCIETTGELAAVKTNEGNFVYVTAERIDSCADAQWSYGWIEPVAFSANGMNSSTLSGSLTMTAYAGPTAGEATLDFSLAFHGTGKVSTTHSRFFSKSDNSITLSFSSSRQRAATASGTLSFGGDDGAVTSAQIVGGTEGDLVVIH